MTTPTDQTTHAEQTSTDPQPPLPPCGKLVRIDGLGHYHWCVDNSGHWGGCHDDHGHVGTPSNLRDACAKLHASYERTLDVLETLLREHKHIGSSHATHPQVEAYLAAKELLLDAGRKVP